MYDMIVQIRFGNPTLRDIIGITRHYILPQVIVIKQTSELVTFLLSF
jgi:hypothetical protein